MCGIKSVARAERVKQAVELYNTGLSSSEVGEIMGLGRHCIVNYLKDARVPRRGRKKYHYDLICEMGQLYESGMNGKEVAAKYGIKYQIFRQLMSSYGFSKENTKWA